MRHNQWCDTQYKEENNNGQNTESAASKILRNIFLFFFFISSEIIILYLFFFTIIKIVNFSSNIHNFSHWFIFFHLNEIFAKIYDRLSIKCVWNSKFLYFWPHLIDVLLLKKEMFWKFLHKNIEGRFEPTITNMQENLKFIELK